MRSTWARVYYALPSSPASVVLCGLSPYCVCRVQLRANRPETICSQVPENEVQPTSSTMVIGSQITAQTRIRQTTSEGTKLEKPPKVQVQSQAGRQLHKWQRPQEPYRTPGLPSSGHVSNRSCNIKPTTL